MSLAPRPRDFWSTYSPSLLFAVKSALAAGASWWLVGLIWQDNEAAALAMISAVIVVQVTSWQTVRRSIERVVGVMLGVSLAVLVAHYLGLSFLTITLLVFLAQVVAMFLQGRRQYLATQIPVSAALTLVIGTTVTSATALAGSYPVLRLLGALVGGLIGTVISFLLSPPIYVFRARGSVASLADQLAEGLTDLAAGVAGSAQQPKEIYTHIRALEKRVQATQQAYTLAAESARLNPWAARSRGTLQQYPAMLHGFEILVRQMRRIAFTITEPELHWKDVVPYAQWPHDYSDVLSNMSAVLETIANTVRAPAKQQGMAQVSISEGMDRLSRRVESCQAQLAQESAPAPSGSAVTDIVQGNRRAARGSVLTDLRRMVSEVREVVKATQAE